MKPLFKIQITWIFALLLAGCLGMTPAPETNNERLALMEISYGTVLDSATRLANEGRLSDSQKANLDAGFDDIETSIILAKTALELADQVTFDKNAANIVTALTVLRTILTEVE